MEMHPSSKRGSMEEEDRLSSLPDDLLHSILRELPLKHAVRTSVLSRRWAPQWLRALASSRVLDFTDPNLARGRLPAQAAAAVRRCLELHAEHGAPLDLLRVALWSPPQESSFRAFQRDVAGWIASAVARGAREVEVKVEVDEDNAAAAFEGSVELPGDLLVASNSLARLALCGFSLRAAPTGGLAGLRSLSLSHVDITGEVLRDVVSSCRALEHLRLSDSECELIWIASETLQVLEIVRCTAVRKVRVTAPALESIAFHDSEFLWTWPDRYWTGNVRTGTDYDDKLVFEFDVDMPALREVYLSRIRYEHDGNTTNYESLLDHVEHAPVWTISCEGYSLPLMFDSSSIQELQLRIPCEDDEDEDGLQGTFTEIFDFLPLLDRLFVSLPGHVTEASDVDAAAAALAGEVVDDPRVYELGRLSFIKLVNFGGTRLELQLLACFLKRAPALEQLVLVTVGEEGPGEAIQRHVSAMQKASPHARLTVCRPSQDRSQNPVHTKLYDQE